LLAGRAAASSLALASPLASCAPVGPNYLRPAAIVSPQYKEIEGWNEALGTRGDQRELVLRTKDMVVTIAGAGRHVEIHWR
jgi:hypothetical protein